MSTVEFLSGLVEVQGFGGPLSGDLAGFTYSSTPAATGSFVQSGPLATLSLPLDFTTDLGAGVSVQYQGEIVATLTVPEPQGALLMLLGMSLVGTSCWRPRARHGFAGGLFAA